MQLPHKKFCLSLQCKLANPNELPKMEILGIGKFRDRSNYKGLVKDP